ncbi:HypC/HybG/HupF family hydrogenase formation chaperone [Candidatus Woesearchaeota archaeon]|nr:HypC/HybG/HupF family hydrogenase formation chaperone [Candidatus Woesearchaeota archaeon]
MPGKIIKIEGNEATVQYPGEQRIATIVDGDYSIGDYVFVSAKIIVQKLSEEEALATLKEWENVA